MKNQLFWTIIFSSVCILVLHCSGKHGSDDIIDNNDCSSLNHVRDILGSHRAGDRISGRFKTQDSELIPDSLVLDSCEFLALFQWAGKLDTTEDWRINPPKVTKGEAFLLGKRSFPNGNSMVVILNDQDSVQQTWMLRFDKAFRLQIIFPLSIIVVQSGFRGVFESTLSLGGDSISVFENGECWYQEGKVLCHSQHLYSARIDSSNILVFEGLQKTESDQCCLTRSGILYIGRPKDKGWRN